MSGKLSSLLRCTQQHQDCTAQHPHHARHLETTKAKKKKGGNHCFPGPAQLWPLQARCLGRETGDTWPPTAAAMQGCHPKTQQGDGQWQQLAGWLQNRNESKMEEEKGFRWQDHTATQQGSGQLKKGGKQKKGTETEGRQENLSQEMQCPRLL